MVKSWKRFLLLTLVMLLFLLVGYIGLGFLYRGHFANGVWINGIYCTGKSVEEVNDILIQQTEIPNFVLKDNNDKTYEISLQEVSFDIDYTSQLYRVLLEQNPFVLDIGKDKQRNIQLTPYIAFEEESLFKTIMKSTPFVEAAEKELDMHIYMTDEGYQLYDGMKDVLDVDKACHLVLNQLEDGVYHLDLESTECYEDLPLTIDMAETMLLYEKVEAFQTCKIVYDMEDTLLPITTKMAAEWIKVDEHGNFILDDRGDLMLKDDAIENFVNQLADEYDSVGKKRIFTATNGKVVEVEGGIYGNEINRKKEIVYLKDAFLSGKEETRIPIYSQQAWHRGKEDIGNTYIEIDMTDQKMYYYLDGELLLETDVVTGHMKRGDDTPSGVNYVYAKQRNRILRGEDYESFVKYWMPVKGGIGIHDASWRKKFGGDIYIKNGSHGCINTPEKYMEELYKLVEKGTPVVMFYS